MRRISNSNTDATSTAVENLGSTHITAGASDPGAAGSAGRREPGHARGVS